MNMEVTPDSVVIDRLGGTTEVAKLCRVRPQAVSQWRRTGIPEARRDFLQLLKPQAFCGATCTPAAQAGALT